MASIKSSELITNEDGSIFHLHLLPEDLADDIILVGDPGRVETIASHFQQIELKKSNREFYTITGSYRGHRLSVISTVSVRIISISLSTNWMLWPISI